MGIKTVPIKAARSSWEFRIIGNQAQTTKHTNTTTTSNNNNNNNNNNNDKDNTNSNTIATD